jgi:hypothetical protein
MNSLLWVVDEVVKKSEAEADVLNTTNTNRQENFEDKQEIIKVPINIVKSRM